MSELGHEQACWRARQHGESNTVNRYESRQRSERAVSAKLSDAVQQTPIKGCKSVSESSLGVGLRLPDSGRSTEHERPNSNDQRAGAAPARSLRFVFFLDQLRLVLWQRHVLGAQRAALAHGIG